MDNSPAEMTPRLTTESSEGASRTEVTMSKGVYNTLEQRTRAQTGSSEFMVLLLGRDDIATDMVDIGLPFDAGVKIEGLEDVIVADLQPFIAKGMHVIAGYHNHPPDTIADYSGERFPQAYGLCPSPGDLRMALRVHGEIARRLGQLNYPQLIGGVLRSGFGINGFHATRYMTGQEEDTLYTPDLEIPGSTIASDILASNGNPVLQETSYYTDAQRIYDGGYFTFVPVFKGDQVLAEEVPNPLEHALRISL